MNLGENELYNTKCIWHVLGHSKQEYEGKIQTTNG